MIGSFGDMAWDVNDTYDFSILSFDSTYKIIASYFYSELRKVFIFTKDMEVLQI